MSSKLVLGIETSCDETAAAVVDDTGLVLSDVVRSQVELHAPYGGIVPELASRDHMRSALSVVDRALQDANVALRDLDGIAVTVRPGLVGALLVGIETAKGLALGSGVPLVGIDHLVGHLASAHLRRTATDPPGPEMPLLGVLVSGGHTALLKVRDLRPESIEELGATRDDAAGEAFDKVAKRLGLGYPGGPRIDRLAEEGDPGAFSHQLPRAMPNSLEFSFSGLKTAMVRIIDRDGPFEGKALRDLCAAFQTCIVETITEKAIRAARKHRLTRMVVTGGVAANRGLRAAMTARAREAGIELWIPPLASCTDNAAMIAFAGVRRLVSGDRDGLSLNAATTSMIPRRTRKGGGPRPAVRR